MTVPGKFIVIESTCDGAGKSSLAAFLKGALLARDIETWSTFEPGDSYRVGGWIRETLLHPDIELTPEAETFLFLADRAQHVDDIQRLRDRGRWVLCDRYTLSTLAYQGVRHPELRETLPELCRLAQRGLEPDLTILLDLPVSEMKNRLADKKADRFEMLGEEFFEKVRQEYLDLAYSRQFIGKRLAMFDATLPMEELHQQVIEVVEGLLIETPPSIHLAG